MDSFKKQFDLWSNWPKFMQFSYLFYIKVEITLAPRTNGSKHKLEHGSLSFPFFTLRLIIYLFPYFPTTLRKEIFARRKFRENKFLFDPQKCRFAKIDSREIFQTWWFAKINSREIFQIWWPANINSREIFQELMKCE